MEDYLYPGHSMGGSMRISDLSKRTGVPVATIKFYLREHLLPPGTATSRNQARYGEAHLRRLRLIRALTSIGHLDLSSVRELLRAIEDESQPLTDLYEVANRALMPQEPSFIEARGMPEIQKDVDWFLGQLGWQVDAEAPGRTNFAQVLAALQLLGCKCGVDFFLPHAEPAERLAVQELDLLSADGEQVDRAAAVARTVLLNVGLALLRRMAQEHHLALRFGAGPPAQQTP
jgi:DNA-binding transcriptional MerR regulator